ncbi:hypothetical protein [Streptomyces sp. SAI-127]|uniref:hypothetical protein n=1 Tax=Streptomyces sp. SAI-127 TaxID=2940543 RepID=UPI00247597D1|nr:hypothetical protein [Streptomyces sp. SAI-127]
MGRVSARVAVKGASAGWAGARVAHGVIGRVRDAFVGRVSARVAVKGVSAG